MQDSIWNLPSPMKITILDFFLRGLSGSSAEGISIGASSITGEVQPNTSPFDLGLVYGKLTFLYPLSFSKSYLTLTNVVLN